LSDVSPIPNHQYEQGAPGDPESVARAICLQQLTQQARTRVELATVLRRRGIPDKTARTVLDRFVEVGLINDKSLAENFALAQHRERGLSGRAVALKLHQRGLPDQVVESALTLIDEASERDAARRLVARKLPALRGLPQQTQMRRLVGLLARRGYSSGMATSVAREALGSQESEPIDDDFAAE
jgi:regulatory protein